MNSSIKVTVDFMDKFHQAVDRFKKDAVLIGIPADDPEREDGDPITNAAILAINHFGSEEAHIPPRPVLSIGIKNAKDDISEQFKLAAQNVLKQGVSAIETYYERAGIIASTACKQVISDGKEIARPSEATLKARKYIGKSGFKGTKSLLVTGQLRNAITYVVQSIWGR
jgi:hypothetical protein